MIINYAENVQFIVKSNTETKTLQPSSCVFIIVYCSPLFFVLMLINLIK